MGKNRVQAKPLEELVRNTSPAALAGAMRSRNVCGWCPEAEARTRGVEKGGRLQISTKKGFPKAQGIPNMATQGELLRPVESALSQGSVSRLGLLQRRLSWVCVPGPRIEQSTHKQINVG